MRGAKTITILVLLAIWPWPVAYYAAEYAHVCGWDLGWWAAYAPQYAYRDIALIATAAFWLLWAGVILGAVCLA